MTTYDGQSFTELGSRDERDVEVSGHTSGVHIFGSNGQRATNINNGAEKTAMASTESVQVLRGNNELGQDLSLVGRNELELLGKKEMMV